MVLEDTIPAGHVADRALNRGAVAKIMTVRRSFWRERRRPIGARARRRGRVLIYQAAKPGANVRRAAEDVAAGDRVLLAGAALGPAEIGVLASLGLAELRFTVAARGRALHRSELVEVDQLLRRVRSGIRTGSPAAYCQQVG